MKQCIRWRFETLFDATRFIRKFYDIQEIFFPDNMVVLGCIPPDKDDPLCYIVNLKDKPKFQRKAENEKIDDNESRIRQFDTVSFTKQIRSHQYPDRNSWMRKMKSIKVKGKKQ